jgi:hypothetical protein
VRLGGFGFFRNFVGLGGLVLEEAERGIPLAQDTIPDEPAEALR